MKCKNVFRDTNGVSPVIGMILIISIVTISIAIIYTSGLPFIDTAKYNTQLTSARNSFTVLHNDILEVANGPVTGAGTGRITKLDIGGGSLSVEPNETTIIISYTGAMTDPETFTPGTITYYNKGRSVMYENGAVFSNYGAGSFMEIEPLMYAADLGPNSVGLMIHIINIIGSNTSVAGTSTGKIRTFMTKEVEGRSMYVDDVTITISSRNNDSWGRYFNETLTEAHLQSGSGFSISTIAENTEQIKINGSGTTEDIYLSIYWTEIESNAE